jgi:2'-5' RNA ligase
MLLRVAARPPAEAREHLAAAVHAAVAPGQGVTPIPADRLHVVVAQLGNIQSEEVPRLSSTLSEAMPDLGSAPTLRVAGGSVAEERSYHVVVAGMAGEVDRFKELARDVGVVVSTRRLYIDRRRFQPVIPVAALDPGAPADAATGLLSALASYEGPTWTLAGLTIMRGSWSGAERSAGPLYQEMKTFALVD